MLCHKRMLAQECACPHVLLLHFVRWDCDAPQTGSSHSSRIVRQQLTTLICALLGLDCTALVTFVFAAAICCRVIQHVHQHVHHHHHVTH
jgi:hypothetical protein